MGKRNKKTDNFFGLGINKKYVAIPHEILDSPVWQTLSKSAQLAYINVLKNYNGFNAHEIICPRNSLVCKLSSRSWLLATKELEEAGFILVIRSTGYGRIPNKYSLSNNWKRKK